ncbi:MAG: hypothetical protein JW712_04940 [Dehalococcoidales bacterium]|nr:hypothetical protein [Dehalococcoidales bacterium]
MRKIVILLLSLSLLPVVSCTVSPDAESAVIYNEDLIISRDFDISSESTDLNTSVRGTVFLSGAEGIPEHAEIIAWVEVDPDDWGGVMFGIPKEWNVSGITSSYPGEGSREKPEDLIAVWGSNDTEFVTRYDYNKMVEIGTNRWKPTGGGTGMVIIQLEVDPDLVKQTDVFTLTVGAGSSENDGIKSIFPDWQTIEIPFQEIDS